MKLIKDSMSRRYYSALLLCEELDFLHEIATQVGVIIGGKRELAFRLIDDVPIFNIERELTVRLESQNQAITENDFRDMQTFCSVVKYADVVISEKQFASLATQAGLHKKYDTVITRDILDISAYL